MDTAKKRPDPVWARRQLRHNAAKRQVDAIINKLPPLTDEQRQELAEMLWSHVAGEKRPA